MLVTRYTFLLILSLLALAFNQTFLASEVIHEKAEYPKVSQNLDGSVTILSKRASTTLISKLDKAKNFLYHQSQFNLGYSTNAQFMENEENAYTLYHKANGKEYLSGFKDEGKDLTSKEFNTYHSLVSSFTLKNGKIFFAGIVEPPSKYTPTTINVKTYYANRNADTGITLNNNNNYEVYSNLISCAEVLDNEVYCAYIAKETLLQRHSLNLQHFKINENGEIIVDKAYLIKYFYTDFNLLKLIKIEETQIGIIFQTGNNNEKDIPYGNSGKDMYFVQLEVTPTEMEVKRYDYIYNNCRLRKDNQDYTADIVAIPYANEVYVICEVDNGSKDAVAFELIRIYGTNKGFQQKTIDNLGGKGVKNPVFAKFDKLVGIVYTRLGTSQNDVMLLMMGYPDCSDSTGFKIFNSCPNNPLYTNTLNGYISIFLTNQFLSRITSSQLSYRIINTHGIKVYNGNTEIELNKDYAQSTISNLNIKESDKNVTTYIEYMVTSKESDNDVVLGKTCKIEVNFPECLTQCDGCDIKGDEKNNHCFGCKERYYPISTTKDTTGCGLNNTLYNCGPCDIACTQCFGPFDDKYPTTNCKYEKCDFEKGYYPFAGNTTICIKEKEEWEDKVGCALYLDDKSENNKEWKWRCCHSNCSSCHLGPTKDNMNCDTCKNDFNLYFFCNQTKESGIPGNCHKDCTGEGCYKSDPKDTENMPKMCPCFAHCKECVNNKTCDKCYPKWLLPPEKTSCDKKCDYCLTPYYDDEKTGENGRCINCATFFDPPQYTFDGKCYSKVPWFTYKEYNGTEISYYEVNKSYHVIDETCNLLTACKRGCKKCKTLFQDDCTECDTDYYKEHLPGNKTEPFRCFARDVCLGLENHFYPHMINKREGGVLTVRNGDLFCLNCKIENGTFRQPANEFYCGPNRTNAFLDVPDYNKLEKCYVRCKTCEKLGTQCSMACTSCRDSKYYDLIRYNQKEGQCYRKQHKCGIYPYYHNYELAIDEDDCGEDCDVCLYNFQCPKEFPFFKYETHECVEFCDTTVVLGGQCNVNSSAAILLMLRNPFGLRNPYDYLNRYTTISEIINSAFFQYICSSYSECKIKDLQTFLNGYGIGQGKVFNLPQSYFYIGNNISIELSSVKLEIEKIAKYLKGEKPTGGVKVDDPNETDKEGLGGNSGGNEDYNISVLDLTECEAILKKKYNIPEEEDLMIIKADFLNEQGINMTEFLGTETDYQIFSYSLGAFLPLQACKEAEAEVTVYNPFNNDHLIYKFQSKTASVMSNGYDAFDVNSPFYHDVCSPFTNENGNDVLLDDRRKYYYNENVNLCEKNCTFLEYNTKAKTYSCRCGIKSVPGEGVEKYTSDVVTRKMPDDFKNYISRRSNIIVFKCASQVFSPEGQKKNFGSYILLGSLAAFIGVVIYHFVIERSKSMDILYQNLARNANPPKNEKSEGDKDKKKDNKKEKKEKKEKKNKKESKVKPVNKEKDNYDELINGKSKEIAKAKVENAEIDLVYNDDQINFAPYEFASSKDNRSFFGTYWSFLKSKQSILFTFVASKDNILRSTKIALFILFFAFYMAFTALFFNDEIMRKLYIYKGNTNAAVHVSNIVLSSLCSFIASIIVRFVCLNERDIQKVLSAKYLQERKKLAERSRKIASIKLYILYGLSGLLIMLCWYYVSAFCAVFKNSQKNYLINFFICFVVCNLWPVITCFIPTIMRKAALEKYNETLYKASQIVSIF